MNTNQAVIDYAEQAIIHTYNRFPVVFDHGEGVRLYDADGKEQDVFRILADSGVNYARIRVWNDPFDKDETFIDENGTVIYIHRVRPMGAKINEGGAIVWNGTNG